MSTSTAGSTGRKILVANLGSTSFKYRLFDMQDGRQLARGAVQRIGLSDSSCEVEIGDYRDQLIQDVPDHAVAVKMCLQQLTDQAHGCLADVGEVAGIGFKAVHGGRISGVQRVTPEVLAAMREMNQVAPAHNPPYIDAMQTMSENLPEIPLVAAFETGFHVTIPPRVYRYAVPREWEQRWHVRRWGFHGASHRYIAERSAEIAGRTDLRVVSCHLGGSSSLCAIRNGKSVATSMGMSPQSGAPQNNRVGDFDPFAIPWIMQQSGLSLSEVLQQLAENSGLLGVSGVSGDIRDLQAAAESGNRDAELAIEVYVTEVRRHLGGLLVELSGAEMLVFTGGIGENAPAIREQICRDLKFLGIELDLAANRTAAGEASLAAPTSSTEVWVLPTNEELIVARQTDEFLKG